MPEEKIGLCATCKHVRVVRSDRGSVFYQCLLAATDSRFAKYPRLPVLRCSGYEKREAPTRSADEGSG